MQDFRGILFTLKKRMQNPSKDDNDQYDFLTCGYYDGLDIRCIDKWYDYRPKGLMNRGLAIKMQDQFIDLFTIKALFPENVNALEEQGFFYMPILNQEEIKVPFMALSLMNISEQFADQCMGYEALNQAVYSDVRAVLNENQYRSLKCAVFPAIGYSDYIILYFSESFSEIASMIDGLRRKKLANNRIAFSSCYTVCGINPKWDGDLGNFDEAGVKLSIKINLKSGRSSRQFISEFKKKAKELYQKEGISEKKMEEIGNDWKQYFHTFGNSDSIFISDGHLRDYFLLYKKRQLFNPESSFFQSYITNIHSSIHIKEAGIADEFNFEELKEAEAKGKRIQKIWAEYSVFIEKFEDFIKQNNLHKRILKSLEQMMKNYINLAQLLHSFEVEVIIGQIFEALIQNLRYVMDKYDTASVDISLHSVIASLNKFRDIISVYITDMAHSDKLFIEGQTLTHPSIGSAAKLLFAYNNMLLNLMNRMRSSEREEALSKFRILVTSGGCDRTNVRDLFSDLGNKIECPKILIATIPEISLYDIKGTTFRLFHECMHFCGKRHRKERYHFFLRSIVNYISHNISVLIYSSDSFELYFREISTYFVDDPVTLEKVRNELNEIYIRNFQTLHYNLNLAILENRYFCEYDNGEYLDYYFKNLERNLFHVEKIAELFLSDIMEEGTLGNRLYHCLNNSQMALFKDFSDYAKEQGILYTGFDSYIQHKRYLLQRGLKESEIVCFLHEYLGLFLQQFYNRTLTKIENAEDVIQYDLLFDAVSGAFKESFADCFSMKALDMGYVDFLLSFIYEEWDMELALPYYFLNIIRIGADLSVMYHIEGRLSQAQEKKIIDRVEHWKTKGYEYQNVDQLIKRINSILSDYDSLKKRGLTVEIENYLKLCIDDKDFPICEELIQFYQACDFTKGEDLYMVMEYLTCEWEGLRDGSKEVVV